MLPLVLTSLSQRIDDVRVQEIADYSTYYQPVVMRDIFGFGKPMDHRADAVGAGHPDHGVGPRRPADRRRPRRHPRRAAVEEVDRRPAERDIETVSVDIAEGTMGAVRFQVIGKVDGVPRVILEHVTRTRRGPGARVAEAAGG